LTLLRGDPTASVIAFETRKKLKISPCLFNLMSHTDLYSENKVLRGRLDQSEQTAAPVR
jgi:hypothetical protein